jgi:hypothetical protein
VIDLMKGVERKFGEPAPPPEPRPRAVADQEVVQLFVAQLRRQILQEIEEAKAAEPSRVARSTPWSSVKGCRCGFSSTPPQSRTATGPGWSSTRSAGASRARIDLG